MSVPVLWLDELRADDLPRAGAKLARLGELAAHGHRVPRGFVLPVEAFTETIPKDARTRIHELITGASGDRRALERVSAEARALVEEQPLPAGLERTIRDAYARLGDVRVAVRSSGVAEDGELASFAGQFATYLGIAGADSIVEHVKRCWASQYTARALDYCRRNGLASELPGMAVGVLEMVAARSSGVAFTVDPVEGNRERIVIEASWGLGEVVVAGRVTPDRWVVEKASGRILDEAIADKDVRSVLDEAAGQVVEQPTPDELRRMPCLAHEEVAELAAVALAIERRDGCPQDVEWALDETGGIVLLQHRPETTWRDAPEPAPFDPVAYTMRNVLGAGGGER